MSQAGPQAPKAPSKGGSTISSWRASYRKYRREHKWLGWGIPLAVVVLAFSYPWWGLEGPLSFIFNDGLGIDNDTLFIMSIYVMLALGLNVVVGYAGLLDLGFRLGLFAFTAAVLGGIGNLSGAVLGGVVLGLIEAYVQGFWDARWTTTVIFSVLIAILVFRPSGLLGEQVPEGQ